MSGCTHGYLLQSSKVLSKSDEKKLSVAADTAIQLSQKVHLRFWPKWSQNVATANKIHLEV